MTSRSLHRRTLLGGAMAITAATGLSGAATADSAGAPDPLPQWRDGRPRPGVTGLLALFTAAPVVALNEGVHHLQDTWDFLTAVMWHPGFHAVDALVVELGNSRLQTVADDYVSGGIVRRSRLQEVWRDTTQSLSAPGNVPAVQRVFDLARAVNLFASRRRPLRVLLADPPIDWREIHSPEEYGRFLSQRDTTWADVITREVLDKGQRCLTVGGGLHFFRNLPFLGFTPPGTPPPLPRPSVAELVEQRHPGVVNVVHTHALLAADTVAEVEQHVAGWPRPGIATARHTPYGRVPAAAILGDLPPDIAARLTGLPVADLADHVLFLGPRHALAAAVPDWEVFHEPTYWAELTRRKAVSGYPGDLERHRHEADPAMFPEDR